MALCQHSKTFLIHIISMLQTVHSGFHCCLHTIISVGMRHHSHAFFMSDMHHLFHFSRIQRCPRDSPMRIKIHDTRSHDLDKIRTCFFRFQHTVMKFSHRCKTLPDNRAIVSFFMNCKNRSPVIYPILRCNLFRSRRNTQCITAITDKSNSSVLISFQMLPYDLIIRTILMQTDCITVVHTIHNYMRMTLSKHSPFLFLFSAVFLLFSLV